MNESKVVAFTVKQGNAVFSWEKYTKQVIMTLGTATRILGETPNAEQGRRIISEFVSTR